jgi:hypothetical protein
MNFWPCLLLFFLLQICADPNILTVFWQFRPRYSVAGGTVNLLAYAFAGSNPALPTAAKSS